MKSTSHLITSIAVVLLGLNAGFFYTWSFTIMQAFDLIAPEHAIDAMQSVNRHIRNGWFALIFFGAPVISVVALILQLARRQWSAAAWAVLACVAIAVTVVTTLLYHVPWNEALAEVIVNAAANDAAGIWTIYSAQWTATNHVRAAASTTAFVAMLIAMTRPIVART